MVIATIDLIPIPQFVGILMWLLPRAFRGKFSPFFSLFGSCAETASRIFSDFVHPTPVGRSKRDVIVCERVKQTVWHC